MNTEPIEAEVVPTHAVAVREPQQTLAVAPLWGTDDQAAILAKATLTANSLKDVVKSRGLITNIQGREYPRCEAWTLLGSLLGVFPVLCWTKQVENGWEARVEAKTLSGSIVGAAEAQCCRNERNWNNRDDFALRSMAQTRATAKALRMPLGFIMTLAGYEATPAEEMGHEPSKSAAKQQEFRASSKPTQPTEERQPIQFNEAKFRKDAEAWLETEKVKWVKENTNVKAWATLVVESCILITEPMSHVTASKLFFRVFKQLDSIVSEIKSGKITENGAKRQLNTALIEERGAWTEHISETAIGPDEQAAYDKVYPKGESAGAATDGAPADLEWFWGVICPIPHKGEKRSDYEKSPDTIGSLYEAMKGGDEAAQKRLWGFARGWTPEPRTVNGKTYQPSEADLKFREALNDFMSWHNENETTE